MTELISIAEDSDRSTEFRNHVARLLISHDDPRRAQELLQDIVANELGDAATYRLLGVALFQQQHYADAAAAFASAFEKNDSDIDAFLSQAISLERANLHPEALPIWQELYAHPDCSTETKVRIDLMDLRIE